MNTEPLDWESNILTTRPKIGDKKIKNPKAFINYSQATDNVLEKFRSYYNPTKKKRKVLIVFDMTTDIEANLKLSPTFTELF